MTDQVIITEGQLTKVEVTPPNQPTVEFGLTTIGLRGPQGIQGPQGIPGTYTAGTGLTLSGGEFRITNTAVTAGSYGSASQTLSATVNDQGQLTALSAQSIAIANTQVSGLGTMSTQNANSVNITGGSIINLSTFDGITIDGGTF